MIFRGFLHIKSIAATLISRSKIEWYNIGNIFILPAAISIQIINDTYFKFERQFIHLPKLTFFVRSEPKKVHLLIPLSKFHGIRSKIVVFSAEHQNAEQVKIQPSRRTNYEMTNFVIRI